MNNKLELSTKSIEKLEVKNDEDIFFLAKFLQENAVKIKGVKDHFEPQLKATYSAHKIVKNEENTILKPLEDMRKIANEKIEAFKLKEKQNREAELNSIKIENNNTIVLPSQPQKKYVDESGKTILTLSDDFDIEIKDIILFLKAVISVKLPPKSIKIDKTIIKTYIKSMNLDTEDCESVGINLVERIKTKVRT